MSLVSGSGGLLCSAIFAPVTVFFQLQQVEVPPYICQRHSSFSLRLIGCANRGAREVIVAWEAEGGAALLCS